MDSKFESDRPKWFSVEDGEVKLEFFLYLVQSFWAAINKNFSYVYSNIERIGRNYLYCLSSLLQLYISQQSVISRLNSPVEDSSRQGITLIDVYYKYSSVLHFREIEIDHVI